MVASYKAALQVYDEMGQKSPAFKKIYDNMVKFREDQLLWFRVAEKGYDDFMHTIHSTKVSRLKMLSRPMPSPKLPHPP